MKTAEANWKAELWATCPYCDEYQEIKWEDIEDYFEKFGICQGEDVDYTHICEDKECENEFKVTRHIW